MSDPTVRNLPDVDTEEAIRTVEKAIQYIQAGKMVIMVDDEDRENEGDFVMAAEKCTPGRHQFYGHARSGIDLPLVDRRAGAAIGTEADGPA